MTRERTDWVLGCGARGSRWGGAILDRLRRGWRAVPGGRCYGGWGLVEDPGSALLPSFAWRADGKAVLSGLCIHELGEPDDGLRFPTEGHEGGFRPDGDDPATHP